VLELIDLRVHYGNIAAVDGVSVTVGEGEIVAIIGPNGAGKTSTLRALSDSCGRAAGASSSAGSTSRGGGRIASWPSGSVTRRRGGDSFRR